MSSQFISNDTTFNIYTGPDYKRQLASSFQPGCYDVICARGKSPHNHEGNQRFRGLARLHQESYGESTCKHQKSKIVSHIVNTIRHHSQEGGFVKLIDGIWYEVGDRAATDKVGQTFRDLLHTKYSSSTKAKARVRIQRRVDEYNSSEDVDLPRFEAAASPMLHREKVQDNRAADTCHATVVSHDPDERDAIATAIPFSAFTETRQGSFEQKTFDSFLPTEHKLQSPRRASITMVKWSIDDELLGAELAFLLGSAEAPIEGDVNVTDLCECMGIPV